MSCLADQNIFATLTLSLLLQAGVQLACVTDETKSLVKFICGLVLKSIFLAPTFVLGFDYVPLLAC